jgi:hypothetical protein
MAKRDPLRSKEIPAEPERGAQHRARLWSAAGRLSIGAMVC